MNPVHRKNSLRLKGFDYSQPANYFVTICTKERACIFGEISNGMIHLSAVGEIVKNCWEEIPEHFSNVVVDTFQIMPNHVHGIVTIRYQSQSSPTVGVEHVQPLQDRINKYQHVVPGSLSSIIRSFKAAVTKEARDKNMIGSKSLWQRNFHDHIIRSDVSHFFIARYIMLNPLFWNLDFENPSAESSSIEVFKETLKKNDWFTEEEIEYLIEYEIEYRNKNISL